MERKLIAVAVSTALGLPLAANAVELAVSGQVNRSIVIIDQDGNDMDGDVQHVDGPATGSRLEFKGNGELDNGLTAGFHLEYGYNTGGMTKTGAMDDDGEPVEISTPINARYANVYVASEGGTVTVGHGGTATDGMMYANLGGPSWLGGVTNWCSYGGSGPGCNSLDGGRQGVVRYDTPAIGPMSIAVSVGEDEYWDGRVKIAGAFGDSGYDLRAGYIGDNGEADQDVVGVSGSVKFPQGTAIWASWAQNSDADKEAQHISLDHSYGAGSIGVSYRQGSTGSADGSTWNVGFGHALGNATHAYAGYRFVEGDGQNDLAAFFAGMRVRFN